MTEKDKLIIHSSEMQELISSIPRNVFNWGLFSIFATVILIIGGSYFIKYPDIITVPMVITFLDLNADHEYDKSITIKAVVPVVFEGKMATGQAVTIRITDYSNIRQPFLKGHVKSLFRDYEKNCICAEINLTDSINPGLCDLILHEKKISGKANIVITNDRLIIKFVDLFKSSLRNKF